MPLLEGDPVRLAQLLDNLVSNAIRFTPEGGRVDVRSGIERGEAVLEVRDSGIGISASDQAQLFGRFFRASNATAQGIPGTGLGLAISKAIVDAHGGEIGVTSEENVGTTFRARIPDPRSERRLARDPRALAVGSAAAAVTASLRSPRRE